MIDAPDKNADARFPQPQVFLQEVGPRDGLQNEPRTLSWGQRAGIIDTLSKAGLPRIQIGSFVNPRRVPQMAETEKVWRSLSRDRDTRYSVLILNQRGLDRALEEAIPHVEIYVSASETHSMRNSGTVVRKALSEAKVMLSAARRHHVGVTAGVMCAFGCFFEGSVDTAAVIEIVRAFASLDPEELALADTAGMACPGDITRVIESVGQFIGIDRVSLHLHNTHGFGYENLRVALSLGVRRFDTSVGGLGGCPFIPGAAGNISTEYTVAMVESLGYMTGVDVGKVVRVRKELARLLGRKLPAVRKT